MKTPKKKTIKNGYIGKFLGYERMPDEMLNLKPMTHFKSLDEAIEFIEAEVFNPQTLLHNVLIRGHIHESSKDFIRDIWKSSEQATLERVRKENEDKLIKMVQV